MVSCGGSSDESGASSEWGMQWWRWGTRPFIRSSFVGKVGKRQRWRRSGCGEDMGFRKS